MDRAVLMNNKIVNTSINKIPETWQSTLKKVKEIPDREERPNPWQAGNISVRTLEVDLNNSILGWG